MKDNIAVRAHRQIVMNRRVRRISGVIASLIPEGVNTLLDVGAGTGEMVDAVRQRRAALQCQGVDVYIRPNTVVPVTAYDGDVLPFPDASFDAVMTVDVLHHCADPEAVLAECARVSRRWVIIKDHLADSRFASGLLRFMDWFGNRAHGVVLPYNYLSSEQWHNAFARCNLHQRQRVANLHIYPMPFSLLFDGRLHFAELLEKSD